MDSQHIYAAPEHDEETRRKLEQLAAATDRTVLDEPPPAEAQRYRTYSGLEAAVRRELADAAEVMPNDLDRREGENRRAHRARLRAARADARQ